MKPIAMLATLLLLFSSCSKNAISGSGDVVTQTRSVSAFTGVETHYDIAAVITYGNTQEVRVTGYENLINILETKVENGVLKLTFKHDYNTIRNVNVVAYITVPAITKATIHGSRNIDVSGFAAGNNFSALIHGSGNIKVRNSAFQNAEARIHGSGDIDARTTQAKEAVASINGSGSISIAVSDKLTATIQGSGNVNYWGNPTVETNIQGSGRVVKR